MQVPNYDALSTLITALGGFVVQLATAIGVLVTLYISIRNNQKIQAVAKNTDGMRTELVAFAERANLAEGEIKGRQVEGDKRDATAAVIAERLIAAGTPAPVIVAPALQGTKDKPVPVHDDKVVQAIKQLGDKQDQVGEAVESLDQKVADAAKDK